MLDTAPFARFEAFFEGSDPADREYLLLEAASGGAFSDEEPADRRGEVTEPEDGGASDDADSDDDSDEEDEFLELIAKVLPTAAVVCSLFLFPFFW